MVSTCLRGRSLLGACSETTQTESLEHVSKPHRNMLWYNYFYCVMVLGHTDFFFALMWFKAEQDSTFKCVRPSIIPLCKYLHKETSLQPLARTGGSSHRPLLFNALYRYGRRESKKGHLMRWEEGGGREHKQHRGGWTSGTDWEKYKSRLGVIKG